MLNFARFFFQGLKNTLRLQNGVNFSYKGPWVPVIGETVIDEWYVGDFMAAEYTICVDGGNINKEIVKCLVVAGPSEAAVTVYGRTSLQQDMISLSASVDNSRLSLTASPMSAGAKKLIFSVTYYHTINEL